MTPKNKRFKKPGIALLSSSKLKQLYSSMLKCRMIHKRARGVSRVLGQEASEVGSTIDLFRDDFIAPSGHELVFHFLRGEPVFTRLRATTTGTPSYLFSHAGSDIERLSMATGTALACRQQKQPRVVVAFAAEGATGDALPHHTLEFASRHKLPIVYVIQHSLKGRSAKRNAKAQDYGMPSIMVDGNDVVAVYRVTHEAIRRAREGHGPALIHCQNIGADDPLRVMENYLKQKRLWSNDWKQKIALAFNRELELAFAAANRIR